MFMKQQKTKIVHYYLLMLHGYKVSLRASQRSSMVVESTACWDLDVQGRGYSCWYELKWKIIFTVLNYKDSKARWQVSITSVTKASVTDFIYLKFPFERDICVRESVFSEGERE